MNKSDSFTRRVYPWFDASCGRWIIDGREVHCGDCFQLRLTSQVETTSRSQRNDGPWHDVRAELSQAGWYLIGLPAGANTRDWDLYEARWAAT